MQHIYSFYCVQVVLVCVFVVGSLVMYIWTAGLFYSGGNQSNCSDMYKEYVTCADPTGCGTGNDALAWDYQVPSSCCVWPLHSPLMSQACTELYMDSVTNNRTDMFPPRNYSSTAYCQKRWKVEKRPKWIVTEFWGKGTSVAIIYYVICIVKTCHVYFCRNIFGF